jgi:hypothetical protein
VQQAIRFHGVSAELLERVRVPRVAFRLAFVSMFEFRTLI